MGVMTMALGAGAFGCRSASATASEGAEPAAAAATPVADEPEGGATEGSSVLELQLHLASAIAGCDALLPASAQGTTRFAAHVVADPGLGAVVESVEVLDDGIGEPAFDDCVVAATLGAELGQAAGVVGEVRFRYSAGAPADNAKEFLAEHPELVAQYPQLTGIRDRAIDAPRSDADATAFATVLAADEPALVAFERWSVQQGIDLSGVHAGG